MKESAKIKIVNINPNSSTIRSSAFVPRFVIFYKINIGLFILHITELMSNFWKHENKVGF